MGGTGGARFQLLLLGVIGFGLGAGLAGWSVAGISAPIRASLVVAAMAAALALVDHAERRARRSSRITQAGLALTAVLAFPVHYATTGELIRALGLPNLDSVLIRWDEAILGALFPGGQISLWLDRSAWIGPATSAGRAVTEILQLFYFSYYFWGFGLLSILASRWISRGEDGIWRFLSAWVGAYLLNFLGYLWIPAIGPQFVFQADYATRLEGYGLASRIQALILSRQATLQDCFPSGHTAISWVVAIAARSHAPRFARAATIGACGITVATLYLRYHYVVDLVAAIPLAAAALAWGGYLRLARARSPVHGTGQVS